MWRPAHLLSPSARQRLLWFPIGPRRRRGDQNPCGGMSWAVQVAQERRLHGLSNIMKHFTHVKTCEVSHRDATLYCGSVASEGKRVSLSISQKKTLLFWDWSPSLCWWGLSRMSVFIFLSHSSRHTCGRSVECKRCTGSCATECHLIQVLINWI